MINGEVYVRKSVNLSAGTTAGAGNTAQSVVDALQQKLNKKKLIEDQGHVTDDPDGASLSVQMIKSKLR